MAVKILNYNVFIHLLILYHFLYSNLAKVRDSSDNFSEFVNKSFPNKMETKFQSVRTSCGMVTNSLDDPNKFAEYIYQYIGFNESSYGKYLRDGLPYAWYSVGNDFGHGDTPCLLEICGYAINETTNSSHPNCDQFTTTRLTMLPYQAGYIATSLRCGCNEREINNCTRDTCQLQEADYKWEKDECALIFEEQNCQTCYFNRTTLRKNFTFLGRNTHEIISMVVRSGCIVERVAHGYIEQDYNFQNITTFSGSVADISPSYHVRSANFTCVCSPEEENESPTKNENNKWKIYVGVGICVAVVCCALILLVVRHIQKRESSKLYQDKTSEKNECIPPDDKMPYIVLGHHNVSSQDEGYPETKIKTSDGSLTATTSVTDTTTPSSSDALKNQILSEVEQKIESFLNTVFGEISKFPLDQQNSLYESPYMNNNELSELSQESRILPRNAFSANLKNPLGSGYFSTVYKGVLTINGEKTAVAVKKLRREDGREIKSFVHEVKTFEIIDNGSEFIVKYFGACCHTDGLYLLTEICERGSLRRFLVNTIRPKYEGSTMEIDKMQDFGNNYYSDETVIETLDPADEFQLVAWCKQIASGMEYLHKKRIIHGDLAIRNVLLSNDLMAKICDFGLSRKCTNKEYYEAAFSKGDFPFNSLAPECVIDSGSDLRKLPMSVDIWAFGCTLWEIFTLGDRLYSDVKGQGILKFVEVRERLLTGVPQEKPRLASDMIYGQMLECWNKIPDGRPSFATLRMYFEKCISEFET